MTRMLAFAAVLFFAASAPAHHCALEETVFEFPPPMELSAITPPDRVATTNPTTTPVDTIRFDPCARCSGGALRVYHQGPCPYDLLRVCPKCGYALPHELKW